MACGPRARQRSLISRSPAWGPLDLLGDSFSVTNSGIQVTSGLNFISDPERPDHRFYVLWVGLSTGKEISFLTLIRLKARRQDVLPRRALLHLENPTDDARLAEDTSQLFYVLTDAPVYTQLETNLRFSRTGRSTYRRISTSK